VTGLEAVGTNFSVAKILDVRRRTRRAVNTIASQIGVGTTENQAREIASRTLTEMQLRKGWHAIFVRLGANTKEFDGPDSRDVPLGENDIFFVDIGPIYDGIEGDAGDTFVIGNYPEHLRIKTDVRAVWDEVRDAWFEDGLSGSALYELAQSAATGRGWELNMQLAGHRLSDFPHKALYDGTLARVEVVPSPDLWVLEIAIVDPERRFGAFYEDLLLADQSFGDPELDVRDHG
jgi:methionyl aminopeptidase